MTKGMSTDEHYNVPGQLPEPLEDHEPTDKSATVNMFVVIAVVAAIGFIAMAVFHLMY